MPTPIKRFLERHPALTFLLMGASFLCMGLLSWNLVHLFQIHIDLFIEHGWRAMLDGAIMQFVEMLLSGYVALALYVFFKLCEKVLVERLAE